MVLTPTVVLGTALSALAGVAYLGLGRRLAARRVDGASQAAAAAFVVWWIGLGAISLVGAAFTLAAAVGLADLALTLTYTYIVFLALYVAVGALLFYLVYVYTGHSRWLPAIAAFYAGLYVWTVWLVTSLRPVGVFLDKWSVKIDYVHDLAPDDPVTVVFLVLLLVPPLVAAIAYATLWFRVPDATGRWRVALVSGALVFWFGSAAVASLLGIDQGDVWQVARRLLGLAAAGVVLLAYFPPAWARRRYDLASLADEVR